MDQELERVNAEYNVMPASTLKMLWHPALTSRFDLRKIIKQKIDDAKKKQKRNTVILEF